MSEKQPSAIDAEKSRLAGLAEELEALRRPSDTIMGKLITRLRDGDGYAAKVFLANEMDKFNQYRGDAIPIIIEKLYGGSGSPWITLERKMKGK